jgi:hypothetical protein
MTVVGIPSRKSEFDFNDYYNKVAKAHVILGKAFSEMRDAGLDNKAIWRVLRFSMEEIGRSCGCNEPFPF